MDRHKVAQFTCCPEVVVPSLQELVCRFIANSQHLKLSGGVLPEHLTSASVKAYVHVCAYSTLTLACKLNVLLYKVWCGSYLDL